MRLRCGVGRLPDDAIGLRNDVPIRHGAAVVGAADDVSAVAGGLTISAAAATATFAARIVAVTVAWIPTVGRVAVKVTPVAFAARRAAPVAAHKQGEHAAQRTAMPSAPTGAAAARICAGVGARIAARAARAALAASAALAAATSQRSSAWPATFRIAGRGAVAARASARNSTRRRANRTSRRPARWPTAFIALATSRRRTTVSAHGAGAPAEDRLEQPTAGIGQEHTPQ
jgi:hypothetical protein